MSTVRLLYSIFILTAAIWSAYCRCHIAFGEQTRPVYSDIDSCAPSDRPTARKCCDCLFSPHLPNRLFAYIWRRQARLVRSCAGQHIDDWRHWRHQAAYRGKLDANETVFIIVFGLTTMVFLATRPKVRRYFDNGLIGLNVGAPSSIADICGRARRALA